MHARDQRSWFYNVNAFETEILRRLTEVRQSGLYRVLRRIDAVSGPRVVVHGRSVINFSSNDYLGLAGHPAVIQAAEKAVRDYGAGARASRLICGSLAEHHKLEETIAEFERTQAAITFSSGYLAATATIPALIGPGDVVVLDKFVHACHVDGARLSGAKLRVFPHNDIERLEEILRWADTRSGNSRCTKRPRTLVVTESVFSMEGDRAPLREIVELKDRYGAWLMVDEAHAIGLYGARRTGLAEELGVKDRIEVRMGTLGKALGAAGGYICGSQTLIEYLVNRARSFIFSTAPTPATAAAAAAAIRIVNSDEGGLLCSRVWANAAALATRLRSLCLHAISSTAQDAASGLIFPLIIGSEIRAVEVAMTLFELGVLIPAVRYPTVPRGAARLRLTVTAAHESRDISDLFEALNSVGLLSQSHTPVQACLKATTQSRTLPQENAPAGTT
ncbi:MAG: 8-amino-7-oxononanoate synthase [Verrucomicrobiae bacterium]|nr:8-amino-7-oxononanoate synthase [Verrucomicrobiae bacterium]